MRTCHILFINSKDPEKIKESLLVAGRNTLTVSDADGFMKMGGMIRFVTAEQQNKTADLSLIWQKPRNC
jgi:nitrogen regulatory protein PII